MTFEAWLKQWISRQPLKPVASDTAFTAEVMTRVRDAAQPSPAAPGLRLSWFAWSRLSFALAAAVAGVMVAVFLRANNQQRLAGDILQQGRMLTLLTDGEIAVGNGGDGLTDADARQLLQMVENIPAKEDSAWLEEIEAMSKLLNELDEQLPASGGDGNDDSWEKELQMLEEPAASAAS